MKVPDAATVCLPSLLLATVCNIGIVVSKSFKIGTVRLLNNIVDEIWVFGIESQIEFGNYIKEFIPFNHEESLNWK